MNSIEVRDIVGIEFDHRNEAMLRLYRAWKRDNRTEFVRLPNRYGESESETDSSVNLATHGFRGRSDLWRAIQVSVDEIRELIGPTQPGATTISKLNRPLAADDEIPGASPGGRLKGDSTLCVSRVIARYGKLHSLYAIS